MFAYTQNIAKSVTLVRLDTNEKVKFEPTLGSEIHCIRFSLDDSKLVVCIRATEDRLYDVETQKQILSLQPNSTAVCFDVASVLLK